MLLGKRLLNCNLYDSLTAWVWSARGEYVRCLESWYPVPSHFLHLLQCPADYHVISILGVSYNYLQKTKWTLQNTAPWDVQKQKGFQLLGGLRPRPPDQGLCPWTPLGALPPHPVIGSRSRTRHILVPLQNLSWPPLTSSSDASTENTVMNCYWSTAEIE